MRRHPVVRQAIPGRELKHGDVGPEERKRARKRRHALAVAAHDGEAYRQRIIARGDGAGEIGDDQAVGAVGHAGKHEGAAWRKHLSGGTRHQAAPSPERWNSRMRRNSGVS
jgi:hypothetical protein